MMTTALDNISKAELWKINKLIASTTMMAIKAVNKVLLQDVKSFLVTKPITAETPKAADVTNNVCTILLAE